MKWQHVVLAVLTLGAIVGCFIPVSGGNLPAEAPPLPMPRFGIECINSGNLAVVNVYDHKTNRDYVVLISDLHKRMLLLSDGK